MKRRHFLLGSLASALRASGFGKEVLGANTAMAGYGLFQAIEAIRRMGFQTIEIHPMGAPQATPNKFPGFEFDALPEAQKAEIRRALEGFRRVTTHLPYAGLSPFARERETAESSVRTIRTAMEATAYLGAELAVLHVIPPKAAALAEARPAMIRRIREWGDYAAQHRFRIAIETGFPASVPEFTGLIREVGHEAVGCTIDVGHQKSYRELARWTTPEQRASAAGIRAYNDVTHQIIDALGPKIWHFHVHDIDPPTWQEHRPVGTGFVDYPRLITKLRQIDYRGLLMLEIAGPGAEIEKLVAESKRRLEVFL